MDNKRDTSIAYLILGIYALMVSWYYNHSLILLLLCCVFSGLFILFMSLLDRPSFARDVEDDPGVLF